MKEKWDVIVIGGGPGGALASKKCAEHGLKTLLLEKKKIPRDKCCSGMIMGKWGQDLIKEEFGDYPENIIKQTTFLDGYGVIVKGAPVKSLDIPTPATWRKWLDTWMCEKAKEAGAVIKDSARVINVSMENKVCNIKIKENDEISELSADYAIGADGSNSTVQKSIFPELKPTYFAGYRECYEIKLDHPENRFNIFPTMGTNNLFFTHEKGNYMLLEGAAPKGRLKEMKQKARQYLIDNHGMPSNAQPLWSDGCVQSFLLRELTSERFFPAMGNILLIGDAAGLNIPISGEGLTSSLKSGQYAALSIIEAIDKSFDAESIYLEKVNTIINKFREIYEKGSSLITEATAKKDVKAYSEAMLEAWDCSLKLF